VTHRRPDPSPVVPHPPFVFGLSSFVKLILAMPSTNIAGQTLHYQIHGTGFPVLLGDSYLWDSAMWAPQIEVLSRSFQVIAPDLWGHG
jgi:hypothetical protein